MDSNILIKNKCMHYGETIKIRNSNKDTEEKAINTDRYTINKINRME